MPDINYIQLQKQVLMKLSAKKSPLTGNEVRFIRKFFKKTLMSFGKAFGVTHVTVLLWEKRGDLPSKISPAAEKCVRLFVLNQLDVDDHVFRDGYRGVDISELAERHASPPLTLEPFAF